MCEGEFVHCTTEKPERGSSHLSINCSMGLPCPLKGFPSRKNPNSVVSCFGTRDAGSDGGRTHFLWAEILEVSAQLLLYLKS